MFLFLKSFDFTKKLLHGFYMDLQKVKNIAV